MSKPKAQFTKAAPAEQVTLGPCSEMQELVFKRATEVDLLLIGGSRGK